jgi:hypothetical protein
VTANEEKVDDSSLSNTPSDTEAALLYLKSKFPTGKFEGRLPPVLLVHQIYSIIKCKTLVDREVVSICRTCCYMIFIFTFTCESYRNSNVNHIPKSRQCFTS